MATLRLPLAALDGDAVTGLVVAAVLIVLGLLLLAPIALPRSRNDPTNSRTALALMAVLGVAFLGGATYALASRVFSTRTTQVLEVVRKYYVSGVGGITGGSYFVITDRGTYSPATPSVYASVRAGHRYSCRVIDHGYTGPPGSFDKEQSAIESCVPAR